MSCVCSLLLKLYALGKIENNTLHNAKSFCTFIYYLYFFNAFLYF